MAEDNDFLDGCELDMSEPSNTDEDIDGIVLFADVAGDSVAIAQRKLDWEAIAGGTV